MRKHARLLAVMLLLTLLTALCPAPAALAADGSGTVTLKEKPADDPNPITIVKESSGETITMGEAIFKVEYFTNTDRTGSPARTWYYKTIDGLCQLGTETYYLSEYSGQKSDPLYKNSLGLTVYPLGSIRVTEAQPPEGYLKADFRLEGTITQPVSGGDGKFQWVTPTEGVIRYVADTAYIHNDAVKGSLKIVKKDKYESTPLSGATFQVLDSTGAKVAEGTTGQNGEVTFPDLLYGEYTYQETKAPTGYKLDATEYPFSITENGVTVEKTATDIRREGTLQVKKQDADGTALSGAAFLLEYSADDGGNWNPVAYREAGDNVTVGDCTSAGLTDGQLSTGADGLATFTGLRADGSVQYRLTETKAPEGMSLIGAPLFTGTLPVKTDDPDAEDSEPAADGGGTLCYTLYVTATDSSTFHLPETGGGGLRLLPLLLILLSAPALLSAIPTRKTNERKEDA